MSLTAVLFVLGFVVGCLLAFGRHPIYGLMTYIGEFYLHPPSRWWGQGLLLDVRWSLIAAGVTLLALMVHKPATPPTPVFRSGAFWGFVTFVAWIAVQSFWALDPEAHQDLLTIYVKFILVMIMICRCIDSSQHLRMFLWTHVLGCFYLGWLAYTSYTGGRLDGVGGPGIDEANALGLQIVTSIMVAASLFLAERRLSRAALFAIIPIIVNALVTTISRSGFLAAGAAGFVFNLFCPAKYRGRVLLLSVLAVLLFVLVTNPTYWARMGTIQEKGADIAGVDTGGGRLELIQAQWRMLQGRPFGCGHMCTTVLSPSYLEKRFLSGGEARASHNTFMTMLVDHGIPGGAFYIVMLYWIYRSVRTVARQLRGQEGFLVAVLPGVAAVLCAITVGDLFVQYPRFEARIWFISVLMVMLHLTARSGQAKSVG